MLTDTMISGIVGAIVGAAVAHIIDAARERRRGKRSAQRALVGEIISLHADMRAGLVALDAFRRTGGEERDPIRFSELIGRLTQLEGKASQVAFMLLPSFTRTRIRAAYGKLRSRFHETKLLLLQAQLPSSKLREVAFDWIDNQTNKFGELAAAAAGVPTRYGNTGLFPVMYIGLGKKAAKRWMTKYDDLNATDREPPWRPEVRLFIRGMPNGSDEAKELRTFTERQIANLRCARHERAVHVTLYGLKNSFDIEIEACCQDTVDRTVRALPGLASRKRQVDS